MDVAVPADRNVTHKETEKKLKYRSLFNARHPDVLLTIIRVYDI
jgi:hypothetical protein